MLCQTFLSQNAEVDSCLALSGEAEQVLGVGVPEHLAHDARAQVTRTA